MAEKNLQLITSMSLNSNLKQFKGQSLEALRQAADAIGARAKQYAQENLEEGRGPSPHTGDFPQGHNFPYIDTGELAASVQNSTAQGGFFINAQIWTPLAYGAHLEIGWRTPKGNFFRYPWLKPAFLRAMREAPEIVEKLMVRNFLNQQIFKDGDPRKGVGTVYNQDQIKAFQQEHGSSNPGIHIEDMGGDTQFLGKPSKIPRRKRTTKPIDVGLSTRTDLGGLMGAAKRRGDQKREKALRRRQDAILRSDMKNQGKKSTQEIIDGYNANRDEIRRAEDARAKANPKPFVSAKPPPRKRSPRMPKTTTPRTPRKKKP